MSIELKSVVLEQIKLLIKSDEKIEAIILFGSRAKGVAKHGSDIDLAIVGEEIGFRDMCRFGTKIDELELPYKVDIINYNTISNKDLKEHIDRVGIYL